MHRAEDHWAHLRQVEPMRQLVAQYSTLSSDDLDTAQSLRMRAAHKRGERTECTLRGETVQVEGARRAQPASAEPMPARAVNAARMGADCQCRRLMVAVPNGGHRPGAWGRGKSDGRVVARWCGPRVARQGADPARIARPQRAI